METRSNLHGRFAAALQRIGLDEEIDRCVFIPAKASLSFAIGHLEDVYVRTRRGTAPNPAYVQSALERAMKLAQAVAPDALRIDLWPDSEDYAEADRAVAELLGAPDETRTLPRPDLREEYGLAEDVRQECRYWALTPQGDLSPLLREVILADLGGHGALASNVFLLNAEAAVLFYLYDDRGADVAAADTAPLMPLYRTFRGWILDEEREKLDKIFASKNEPVK